MYGLDIDLLKSLNMDNLLLEQKKDQSDASSGEKESASRLSKKKDYTSYEELRKEHALEPTNTTSYRLKKICAEFSNPMQDASDEDEQ